MYNLPRHLTAFVGREQEIIEIKGLLSDPACRLLTLVGPGGIGKTRLAIRAAAQVAGAFGQGVFFVPLQSIQSADLLVSAVADALDLALSGSNSPQEQLLNYLGIQEILLLLDNFEQLLGAGGREMVLQMLEAAPKVKFLVTSREVLNLQEEWLYPLTGLATPAGTHIAGWADHDAVRLLVERVGRVRRGFSMESEAEGIVRLCHLVEGMPLALELAATWTKTLTCADVADEIQHSLDFLSTTLRDMPERHHSMEVVFDQAWQRLTPEEQQVFMRLSIFRGGFRRDAAKAVAGATLPVLTTLVDKSLLRWEPDGQRYQVHELLRQYAADRLARMPDLLINSFRAHCDYYLQFVSERAASLYGGRQLETCEEIDANLDNIRVAWHWAVEHDNVDGLRPAMTPLCLYYQFKSRYVDGLQGLKAIVDSLNDDDTVHPDFRGYVLVALAWFYIRLGQIEPAHAAAEEALNLLALLDFPEIPNGHTNDPALPLSLIASIRGDFTLAEQLGQQALRRSHELSHYHRNQHTANYILATIAFATGRYDTARSYAEEAYAIAAKAQDRWYMAYCQHELGNIALISGDYTAAKTYYEAGYTLREAFNDWEGMALACNHLGKVALVQNDYQEARQHYQRSLEIYQKLNDKGGLAAAFDGLDQAAIGLKDFPTARHFLSQGLSIAAEMGFVPLTLSLLASVGQSLCQCNYPQQAAPLLAAAATHPASLPDTQTRARHWLETCSTSFDDSFPEADLPQMVETAHMELSRLAETLMSEQAPTSSETEPGSESLQANQALVEPLSSRELEVLYLLAEGLTNQQISDRLFIVVGTVKKHTSTIYGKLGVSNRTQAVARARELNLLT